MSLVDQAEPTEEKRILKRDKKEGVTNAKAIPILSKLSIRALKDLSSEGWDKNLSNRRHKELKFFF